MSNQIDLEEFLRVFAARIEECGSALAFAERYGLNYNQVSRFAMRRRWPTQELAEALGYRRVYAFVPLGENLPVPVHVVERLQSGSSAKWAVVDRLVGRAVYLDRDRAKCEEVANALNEGLPIDVKLLTTKKR